MAQTKKFINRIRTYGFLGAIALIFLAPACGEINGAVYGPAPSDECVSDDECVEIYGDNYICEDDICIEDEGYIDNEEPEAVYGPAPS